ncbi:general odorant-binding protein 56a-like [Lycorma delicatula]|uniref:general odorant-binding protein 56a-like n=1 Tax=Lycorma delicatula TaxID=130591 RepID=UPI003F50E8F8
MKNIFFISAIILCFHSSNGRFPQAIKDLHEKNCAKEINNLTQEEREKIDDFNKPETEAGKCFLTCVFNQIGVMKDGKIDPDGMKATFEKFLKDKTIQDVMNSIASDCMKKENNFEEFGGCDVAPKFQECLLANSEFEKVKIYLNAQD